MNSTGGSTSAWSQLDFEAELQREMAGSDDFAEGVSAFAEKRAPRFTGR